MIMILIMRIIIITIIIIVIIVVNKSQMFQLNALASYLLGVPQLCRHACTFTAVCAVACGS